MPGRSSRRLAGCIAIELLRYAEATAATEFQAGIASAGAANAIVIQDRHGARAVFADTDFEITQAIADFVAARLLQSYELPRPFLLLRGVGPQPAQPDDLLTAISAALGQMEPAEIRSDGKNLSVTIAGHCRPIFGDCTTGAAVSGPIRAAFRMVQPEHGLLQRTDLPRSYPVQAIVLGKQVVVLALGGASTLPSEFSARGLLFIPHANASTAPPDDPRLREAIRQVLARVGR